MGVTADRFAAYLSERGLKMTRPRREVLSLIESRSGPFEAEDLLIEGRKAGRRVAKATIYRTISLLIQGGLVLERIFGGKIRRYEARGEAASNGEIVCTRCFRTVRANLKPAEAQARALARKEGFAAEAFRFEVRGLCGECGGEAKE